MTFILICIVWSHFCFMCLVIFIIHILGWYFVWVLLSKNKSNFQKDEVKNNFSFSPIKIDFLELEKVVKISNSVIDFLWYLFYFDLLKIVGDNTRRIIFLLINNAKKIRYIYLIFFKDIKHTTVGKIQIPMQLSLNSDLSSPGYQFNPTTCHMGQTNSTQDGEPKVHQGKYSSLASNLSSVKRLGVEWVDEKETIYMPQGWATVYPIRKTRTISIQMGGFANIIQVDAVWNMACLQVTGGLQV